LTTNVSGNALSIVKIEIGISIVAQLIQCRDALIENGLTTKLAKRVKGESRQGIYVFTPQGKFLSSINQLSADAVLETIESGWAKWEVLPKLEKKPTSNKVTKLNRNIAGKTLTRGLDWSLRFTIGICLTISNPTLSVSRHGIVMRPGFQRRKRKKSFPIPSRTQRSVIHLNSQNCLTDRLCRIHFVDSVKGQTEAFSEDEIAGSSIGGKVRRKGDVLKIEINGTTHGERDRRNRKHGVETKLLGTASYDVAK